jgi:hypothetical protein
MGESTMHEWGGSRKWVFLPYYVGFIMQQIKFYKNILQLLNIKEYNLVHTKATFNYTTYGI